MQRIFILLSGGACAGALVCLLGSAQAATDVSLTRLDCGTPAAPTAVNERFSDTYAYGDLKLQLVYSCHLIKHGGEYLLWDTGHAMTTPNVAPKVSLVDQLGQLNLKPEQIKYVGISHYHGDHIGQVGSFPKATLLIGKGDWDVLTSPKPPENANPAPFANWIKGESKVDPVPLDKDVFGDGSVIMLYTPGTGPAITVSSSSFRRRETCCSAAISCTSAKTMTPTGCPRSIPIAPRRWLRSTASRKSWRPPKRPSSSNTTRAMSTSCRHSRPQRSNGRVSASAPSAGRCGALRDSAASAER